MNNYNTLVFLKGFNNYFNRIIKKFDTIAEYQSECPENYVRSNRNFNPNDGVSAEHIENCIENSQLQPLNECDYVLVLNGEEIVSRWFILECVRTRGNQFHFTLRRDVVADHLDAIVNAPCYIEKATLEETDPLIFNSEGMGFNQIKENEILLQDTSRVPWIVGYISRDFNTNDAESEGHELERTKITGRYNVIQASAIDSGDLPWEFSTTPQIVGQTTGYRMELTSGSYKVIYSTVWAGVTYTNEYPFTEETVLRFNSKGEYVGADNKNEHPQSASGSISRYTAESPFNFYSTTGNMINSKSISDFISSKGLALASVPQTILNEQVIPSATTAELLTYNNKIIKDGQRYYRLRVETIDNPTYDYSEADYPSLTNNFNAFLTAWNNSFNNKLGKAASPVVLKAEVSGVRITPEVITQEELEVVIPFKDERIHLNDAPYDMFCIPYGDLHLKTANIDCNKDGSLAMAFYAAAGLGSSVVYDLQLLPYCPCPDYVTGVKTFDESFGQEGFEYNYIKDTQGNVKSIMIWCSNSSGTFNIDKTIKIERPSRVITTPGSETIGNTDVNSVSFTHARSKRGGELATLLLKSNMFKTKKLLTVENLSISGYSPLRPWEAAWTDNPTLGDELEFTQNMELGTVTITYRNSTSPLTTDTKLITFTLFTQYEISETIYDNPLAVDIKVSDACDMYRLVSPNYNGQFEFSLAKNGDINYFNVDYNYKPFTPYIHINPNFGKLYGYDWNDARGLICGGDFSLPMVTSAWTDYQVANKNYQNIFDRQIQNMDVSYDIAHQQAVASAIAGGFTGTISGATTGAMAGSSAGPYGAIAGAAIGGVLGGIGSGIGGNMDVKNVEKAHKEAKDYSNDLYNFNLQNVQAIPYSLAKTSAFTYNNKIWPMVEVYSSTSQEKNAFINKLKYDGMTVMKIDTISHYTSPFERRYVKGQLIRLDALRDDNHMAEAIFGEISKGVYL